MYPLRRYTALSLWCPVLALETYFPRRVRRIVITFALVVGVALLFLVVGRVCIENIPTLSTIIDPVLLGIIYNLVTDRLIGIALIIIALAMIAISLEAFFRSYYFDDISVAPSLTGTLFSFEVVWLLYWSRSSDPLIAFLTSIYGTKVMRRVGIEGSLVQQFVIEHEKRGEQATVPELPIDKEDEITLPEFMTLLTQLYPSFTVFLAKYDVQPSDLVGAADWVVWKQEVVDRRERWWSRENLDRIPSIGSSWGYGHTFLLDTYGRDLLDDPALHVQHFLMGSREREVLLLGAILARQAEANAILVAEPGSTKMDVVYELVASISQGTVVAELKHKQPILFSTGVFLAGFKDKSSFETALLKILNQVVKAGNILFIIDDLPNLIRGAQALDSNIAALLDPYLASSLLQIIALADTDAFYTIITPQQALARRFEHVKVEDLSNQELIRMLEVKLLDFEYTTGARVTYPALLAIISTADQYFSDGALQDKSLDLLIEIMSVYGSRRDVDITKADVYAYIKSKTTIPIGDIQKDEQEKLLNLESFLGNRVVGQTEALSVVANAMRRARTVIRNPKRPIGSFLFLGPTGVGKTETAKALAEAFFGSDEAMNRLDMSEYQGPDALAKLIGSFTENDVGVLTTMMRERPYGVLLLDEFEKTTNDVHNLFLQVLDEGFFSDMTGKRVNVRNTIIIATSNAGTDYLWELSKGGRSVQGVRDELVDRIIKNGIYKPELVNRFDGVVAFHPLSAENLSIIAKIMLEKLGKRLLTQGIELVITPELVAYVANKGASPAFGARPMQRCIQDTVEQIIAKGLIAGTVGRGMKVAVVPNIAGELEIQVG